MGLVKNGKYIEGNSEDTQADGETAAEAIQAQMEGEYEEKQLKDISIQAMIHCAQADQLVLKGKDIQIQFWQDRAERFEEMVVADQASRSYESMAYGTFCTVQTLINILFKDLMIDREPGGGPFSNLLPSEILERLLMFQKRYEEEKEKLQERSKDLSEF